MSKQQNQQQQHFAFFVFVTLIGVIIYSHLNVELFESLSTIQNQTYRVDKQNSSQFQFYIFQLGHHKTGTRSLFDFFSKNDIPSVHNCKYINVTNRSKPLVNKMNQNYLSNELLLTDLDDKYMFYSDYGTETKTDMIPWYEILTKQYPNSKYILLIRNINHWLKSKYTHLSPDGRFLINKVKQKYKLKNNVTNSNNIAVEYKILMSFKNDWYQYICKLLNFFKDKQNLVIFDIEYDSIDKVVTFFEQFNLKLNESFYGFHGNTKHQGIKSRRIRTQIRKFEQMVKRHPDFGEHVDNFTNEYDRIRNVCSHKYGVVM